LRYSIVEDFLGLAIRVFMKMY